MKSRFSLLFAAAAALLAACAALKPSEKKPAAPSAPVAVSTAAAAAAPAAPPSEVTEASLRDGGFAARAGLDPVPFDFDSAKLSDEALTVLKANAEIIKADPSFDVLVAGHCDERGTTAYNLALGQKRAKEVRDYYMSLGIDGGRVATISYGKERPLCSESTEDCWSKNRRAETLSRSKAAASAPAQ